MAPPSPVPPDPPALAPFPPYTSPADAPGAGGKAPLTARSGAPLSAVAGGWARALGHAVRTAGGATADAVHPRHVYWAGNLPSVMDGAAAAATAAADDGDAEPLVVLYDGYPKARQHLLLLPARPGVAPAIHRLTAADRPAVAALPQMGGAIAALLSADAGGGGCCRAGRASFGFFAAPCACLDVFLLIGGAPLGPRAEPRGWGGTPRRGGMAQRAFGTVCAARLCNQTPCAPTEASGSPPAGWLK